MSNLEEAITRSVAVNRSTRPEDIVETTQSIRLMIVGKLLEDGVPFDPKEVNTLNLVLSSLDSAALTTRKLNVEEAGVDVASRTAQLLAQTLKLMRTEGGGNNPFEAKDITDRGGEIPSIGPGDLPEIKKIDGHFKQGVEVLDYAEFVSE